MRARLRRFPAFALAIAALLAGCGGSEPAPSVGNDITILAPVEPGSAQSVELHGVEEGRGSVGIVLAHMLGSTQSAWTLFVEELLDRDFHVLTFDFRGHGTSRGERNASLAALDLTAAVERLRSLGAEKIFVVGASMGGTAAVAVAAEQRLEGVVTISAPLAIDSLDVGEAVRRLDEPALFIVAANDDDRFTSAADQLAASAPEPKQLRVVEGSAAHGTDLLTEETNRQLVTDLIIDFLVANRG